jgi:hypothetical protein
MSEKERDPAAPWAQQCAKHAARLEAAAPFLAIGSAQDLDEGAEGAVGIVALVTTEPGIESEVGTVWHQRARTSSMAGDSSGARGSTGTIEPASMDRSTLT